MSIICKRKSVNYKKMIIVKVLSHLTSNWAMTVFVWMKNSVNYTKQTISEQINVIIIIKLSSSVYMQHIN